MTKSYKEMTPQERAAHMRSFIKPRTEAQAQTLFVASRQLVAETQPVKATLRIQDELDVKVGMPVRVNGLKVGEVTGIKQTSQGKQVGIAVRPGVLDEDLRGFGVGLTQGERDAILHKLNSKARE